MLVIGDPSVPWLVSRKEAPTECVIFCSTELGRSALEAFNRFGEMEQTRNLPAILFLSESQQDFAREAHTAPHRVLLSMPLKVRQLRVFSSDCSPGPSPKRLPPRACSRLLSSHASRGIAAPDACDFVIASSGRDDASEARGHRSTVRGSAGVLSRGHGEYLANRPCRRSASQCGRLQCGSA